MESRRKAKGRRLCNTKGHMGPRRHIALEMARQTRFYPLTAKPWLSYPLQFSHLTSELTMTQEGCQTCARG